MMRPLLFPNEQPIITELPQQQWFVSEKLDGIRCLIIDGQLLSRSLKPLPNKALQTLLAKALLYSKQHHLLLDGELFSRSLSFTALVSVIMSENAPLPHDVRYYCFDAVQQEQYSMPYHDRYRLIPTDVPAVVVHEQLLMPTANLTDYYNTLLERQSEGIIIRHPQSEYKQGRLTMKSGWGYKLKPFITIDAVVIGVEQATNAAEDSARTINELGYSVTSRKLADRVAVEKASALLVRNTDGVVQKVSLAVSTSEKERVWKERERIIGKCIEYKALAVGMKDKLRHPVFVRWRNDAV